MDLSQVCVLQHPARPPCSPRTRRHACLAIRKDRFRCPRTKAVLPVAPPASPVSGRSPSEPSASQPFGSRRRGKLDYAVRGLSPTSPRVAVTIQFTTRTRECCPTRISAKYASIPTGGTAPLLAFPSIRSAALCVAAATQVKSNQMPGPAPITVSVAPGVFSAFQPICRYKSIPIVRRAEVGVAGISSRSMFFCQVSAIPTVRLGYLQ